MYLVFFEQIMQKFGDLNFLNSAKKLGPEFLLIFFLNRISAKNLIEIDNEDKLTKDLINPIYSS